MKLRSAAVFFIIICLGSSLKAEEKTITFMHTNDLHSHFIPFAPELDYFENNPGAEKTMGGWARIATLLKREKQKRNNPVFTVDAGDFTMGSLFHMLAREESLELTLMKKMGYDVVTLGNHEFDLYPDGLARIIKRAREKKSLPEIVFNSAVFSNESPKDDSLEKVFKSGLVKPYTVKEADGVRIGFFGIMGKDSADDAPFASPVKFKNPVEISKEMVRILREDEKADIVVCLSHSGLSRGSHSEDEILAEEVPGIDIIISGHSHTELSEPIISGNTIIVQSGSYGENVGILDITFNNGKTALKNYRLAAADSSIPDDAAVKSMIDSFITMINNRVLQKHNLKYLQIIGKTGFDLTKIEAEAAIGNLLADAIKWQANRFDYDPQNPVTKTRIGIKANGVIRDGLMAGHTGKIAVADLFRTLPLGIGVDNSMGYPITTCYVYGYEIKRALEVVTSVYPIKGSAYFMQISGIKFKYNPRRVIFDRVTEIEIETDSGDYVPLDYSKSNKELYRVASNIYESAFLKLIGSFTYDILEIIPKDVNGKPLESLPDFRIDADKSKPGVQELKEWAAVMDYVRSFEDTTGDGLPDIPERYSKPQGRIVIESSLNPVNLLWRGTALTWGAFAVFLVIAGGLFFSGRLFLRKIYRNK
jgi:5'-nucleotidase